MCLPVVLWHQKLPKALKLRVFQDKWVELENQFLSYISQNDFFNSYLEKIFWEVVQVFLYEHSCHHQSDTTNWKENKMIVLNKRTFKKKSLILPFQGFQEVIIFNSCFTSKSLSEQIIWKNIYLTYFSLQIWFFMSTLNDCLSNLCW